jgi:hypothetical protein
MAKFSSFVDGFGFGMSLQEKSEMAKDRREMRKIADAKPEASKGFTADQGAELQRAADSGQYDIGYDDAKQAYTVTPKADPTQTGTIAQQGVTDFMGDRTAGTMTEDQVANARQRAMAGVVSRRDPVQGNRMLRELKTGEREDKRFEWEEKRAIREDRKNTEADENDAFKKTLDEETGQFMQARLVDKDGNKRMATVDDYLEATQFKVGKLISAGKSDAAQDLLKDHAAQSFMKINLETAQRDQALGQTIAAVNAGNLEAARTFYDRFLPDGATITDFKQESDGRIVAKRKSATGSDMAPMMFKDANHLTASLSALKDPMAVYNYSQNEFRNSLALRADNRAERADGRAAASHNASAAARGTASEDAAARTAAGVALFKERNPNATSAELEAVRRGILAATPDKKGGYKVEAGDVATLLGSPAVGPDGRPLMDPLTGRQAVNRDPAKERQLFEFMRDNNIVDTNEALAKFLAPAGQQRAGQASAAKSIAKGQVVNGYEFLGGNTKDKKNWRQVSGGQVQ